MQKVFWLHNAITPYMLPFFQGLSQRENLTVLFCCDKKRGRFWNPFLQNYSFKNKTIFNLTIPLKGKYLIINPFLPVQLFKNKSDVYIIGDNKQNALSLILTLLYAKLMGRPIILFSQSIDFIFPKWQKITSNTIESIATVYRKFIYRYVDAFVTTGTKGRNYINNRCKYAKKIFDRFCYVPIDPGTSIDKNENNEFHGKKVILYIGYFERRKGLTFLIEAFQELNRDDALLILAGDGPEKSKLETLSAKDANIIFTGYIEGPTKWRLYQIADIFVLPSLKDSYGMVINEAMTFALPVITTKNAGCSDELVKDNGFVIPPADKDALRHKLDKLLDDEDIRKQMGKRSKEIIAGYNLDRAIETIIDAIEYVTTQ